MSASARGDTTSHIAAAEKSRLANEPVRAATARPVKAPGEERGPTGLAGVAALLTPRYISFWIALVSALLLASIAQRTSRSARLANLNLQNQGVADAFIVTAGAAPDHAFLVDRDQSTIRRGQDEFKGRPWELVRFRGSEGGPLDHWFLRSPSDGAVFFIPVESVADRDYPFAYAFVRRQFPDLDLPKAEWVQLHLNRFYQGLFLRVELPRDKTKKEGGSGTLREVVSAHGPEVRVVDTLATQETRLIADGVMGGIFPDLDESATALTWLESKRIQEDSIFLVHGDAKKLTAAPLPLPASLQSLLRGIYGKSMRPSIDERALRWTHGRATTTRPWDDKVEEKYQAEFAEYQQHFRRALANHDTVKSQLGVFALFQSPTAANEHHPAETPN